MTENVSDWSAVIVTSFQDLWTRIIIFLPNLVAALVILVVGLLVASLLGKAVTHLVRALKVDDVFNKSGVEGLMHRSGVSIRMSEILGKIVKWFVIIGFLLVVFDVLDLQQVNEFLWIVLMYLPNVLVAVLILLVASIVADIVKAAIVTAASKMGVRAASLLGTIAFAAIWVFAILASLHQLGIARELVQVLFTGIVAAVAIALGLSFGLGGQKAAADVIDNVRTKVGGGQGHR